MRLRLTLIMVSLVVLAGCGAAQLPWASEERVTKASYRHPGPATITLMTIMANGSKSAGHSSLLINASQRVMYDPAGTWYHREVPERADLLYGVTPQMLQYYLDYHARDRFHVVMQTKVVTPHVAELAMQHAIGKGASANGMCANNTSHVLSQTPGFEGFPVSVWPKNAVEAFEQLPGVSTKKVFQKDEGKDLKT